MLKKSIALLLIVSSILVCAGCDTKEEQETTSETSVAVTEATTVAVPETTPTPEPTPTPSATPTPAATPTPKPEYVEPSIEPEVWYNGFVDPRSVRAQIVEDPNDITVLVNKYYALPEDYVPDDLVKCPHSYDQQLRSEANDAWVKLYDDCLAATGQGLLLVSGWRDWGTQQFLFDRSRNKNGLAFACQKNAIPGRSEHHLGLAMDITPAYESNIIDGFGETTVGKWVDEHCYEYGFIRRYQPQYVYETGYGIEAWHYRYVGVELATYLYENDMSLEAYHGKCQVMPDDE